MQWLAIFMIPIVVGLTSATLGQTISSIFEYHAAKAAKALFFHSFNLDDISQIRAEDKKKIQKHEFLGFMLIMMKKVDQGVIDDILEQFDEMDADKNGFLEPVDLEIINRNKKRIRRTAISRIHGKGTPKLDSGVMAKVRVESGVVTPKALAVEMGDVKVEVKEEEKA